MYVCGCGRGCKCGWVSACGCVHVGAAHIHSCWMHVCEFMVQSIQASMHVLCPNIQVCVCVVCVCGWVGVRVHVYIKWENFWGYVNCLFEGNPAAAKATFTANQATTYFHGVFSKPSNESFEAPEWLPTPKCAETPFVMCSHNG